MFLLIDTANIAEIRRALEQFPLAGVTTCPSIITREHQAFWKLLLEIRQLIGNDRMLHAQVLGRTAEEMLQDAKAMHSSIPGNFYVKIPVTLEGFKAMPMLRHEGIPFTATTIHTIPQAILAAESGAAYLAPYINHIEDEGISGEDFICQVTRYLDRNALASKLLAASFRNTHQIVSVINAGAHHATLAPELVWKLADSPMTDQAVEKFRHAWDEEYGADKNIANL